LTDFRLEVHALTRPPLLRRRRGLLMVSITVLLIPSLFVAAINPTAETAADLVAGTETAEPRIMLSELWVAMGLRASAFSTGFCINWPDYAAH
jgi:hypothetical protein